MIKVIGLGEVFRSACLTFPGDRNDLAGSHCSPALGLEYLKRTIQHIKYLWIGVAMEWKNDSGGDRSAHQADLVVDLFWRGEKLKQDPENNKCLLLGAPVRARLRFRCRVH